MKKINWLIILIVLISCKSKFTSANIYESNSLIVDKITKDCYRHVSFLSTEKYKNIPCNGLIFTNKNEAIVFDTPTTNEVSEELINVIESKLKCELKYVIINHFHEDCLGGLEKFHEKNIKSYASHLTIELAKENDEILPQNGFEGRLELKVGNEHAISEYIGEGHTKDNIISYIPSSKVLFGGCLIKSLKSGRGNLSDANTKQWSTTVTRIKNQYEDVEYVIPGHGKYGGSELLDYTIEMFKGFKE